MRGVKKGPGAPRETESPRVAGANNDDLVGRSNLTDRDQRTITDRDRSQMRASEDLHSTGIGLALPFPEQHRVAIAQKRVGHTELLCVGFAWAAPSPGLTE
jgi:hypothetical protein